MSQRRGVWESWEVWMGYGYPVIPCTVEMTVAGLEGREGCVVAPAVVPRGPCAEADGWDRGGPFGAFHGECCWECHDFL